MATKRRRAWASLVVDGAAGCVAIDVVVVVDGDVNVDREGVVAGVDEREEGSGLLVPVEETGKASWSV